jgi:hypothetical protein
LLKIDFHNQTDSVSIERDQARHHDAESEADGDQSGLHPFDDVNEELEHESEPSLMSKMLEIFPASLTAESIEDFLQRLPPIQPLLVEEKTVLQSIEVNYA